jgi:hypothetical protein
MIEPVMKGFIECNDHTWILFLSLFSFDAQQVALTKKMVQGILEKWRAMLVGVSFSKMP